MLDNKSVDAIVMGTPDHWHALGTILACQAGKDVYVEKPTSHSIWESRKMVDAARKYQRVVQVGTQNRSAPYIKTAIEYLRSGKLGKVHFLRIVNSKLRPGIEPGAGQQPPRRGQLRHPGWDRPHRDRSMKTTSTIPGTGSGSTAAATSAKRAFV